MAPREEMIERERRGAKPAAIAAILPLPIYLASFLITARLATGDTAAEQLPHIHDHAGALLLLSVVRALAFIAIIVPLVYLFRAAAARNPKVQGAMIGFVVLAPVLFAASTVVQGISYNQVASDYVAQAPQMTTRSYAEFRHQVAKHPQSIDKVRLYTDANSLDVQTTDDTFYSVNYPSAAEGKLTDQLDAQSVTVDEDAGGGPGNALAQKLSDDSQAARIGAGLLVPAVIAMVVALVYTCLQATRVGLLTRGFGSLGMALGAAMILIPAYAILAILAWFAYLGFLYLNRIPGGRPPAWETGEMMPWPRPGEAAPARAGSERGSGGAAVEGQATEVGGGDQAADAASGGQAAAARRKRKRRR